MADKVDPSPYLGQRVKVTHNKSNSTGVLLYDQAVSGSTGRDGDSILLREDNGVARIIKHSAITKIDNAYDEDRPGAAPVT